MAGLLRTFYVAVLLSPFLFADSHLQKDAGCPTLPELCRQICVKLAFKTGFCDYGTCICLPVPPLPSSYLESPRFKDLQGGKERHDDAEQREVNLFLRRMSFVHQAQPIDILQSVFKNDYFQKMVRHTRERVATEKYQPVPKIRRNILARGGVFHMHAEIIPTAKYSNEYFSRPSQFGKPSTRSADIRLEGYKWSLNSYIKNHEKNNLRKIPDTLSNVEKLKMDFEGLSFVAEESTNKPDFRPRNQHVIVRIRPTKNKEIAPKAEWFSLDKEDKEEKSRGDTPVSKRFVRKSEKELKNDNNSSPPLKQIVDSLNNIVNNETIGITTNETLKMSDQEQGISSGASGEPNQEQNSTNGETSLNQNNATTQENPTQNQTVGVTNMNETSEILESINETQNQDQKASTNETNEKPTISGDDEKNSEAQKPVTDQAYNPVNSQSSQTENSGTNETSQTEEPDTGLIIKDEKLTTDQMSQEEKPITEDASQAENTTTGEIIQGEEDNEEASQGKEDNEESNQGKEAKGEISQGEIEITGETSTQGEIDTTGETSQGENATTGETSQGEKLPSGEISQGKKLTIREASQDEKPSTGESNQSEKSAKGDIISQDQKAETSEDTKSGTSERSQDEKPATSETNQDEKSVIRESSQNQKPGTNETSQDQKPGTNETNQDQKPGTDETSQDQKPTTGEVSQDKKSETSETSQDKKTGTSESSQDQTSEQQTTIIPENEKLYPFLDLPEIGEKPPNVPSENIGQEKIAPRVERDLKFSSKLSESDTKVLEESSEEEDKLLEPEWTEEENEKEDDAVEDETLEWWKQKPIETENGNQENTDQIEEGDDLYE